MRARDRARRLEALERRAAMKARDVTTERARAALACLSRDELRELGAEALAAHRVDRATAREVWTEHWRLDASRGETWAALAAHASEVIALYVADLKGRAARCGVPPEI